MQKNPTNTQNVSPIPDQLKGIEPDCASITEMENTRKLAENGMSVQRLTIEDREKWKDPKNLRKLVEIVGPTLSHGFSDRTDSTPKLDEDFIQSFILENPDLTLADKIYILMGEDAKAKGFATMRDVKPDVTIDGKDIKSGYFAFMGVDRETEGKGLSSDLNDIVFKDNQHLDVIRGVTHTPAVVKTAVRKNAENANGDDPRRCYFCGKRDGDAKKPLSPKEEKILKGLWEAQLEILKSIGYGPLQEGLPPHYVDYGPGSIPPLRAEELRFKEGDPIGESFQELIRVQQQLRPDDPVFGNILWAKEGLFETPDQLEEGDSQVTDVRRETRESIGALKISSLKDKLGASLAGTAKIEEVKPPENGNLKGKEVFAVKVEDPEKWATKENMRKLFPHFGRIICEAFEDKENEGSFNPNDTEFMENLFKEHFLEGDISVTDTIYVVADKGEIEGFFMTHDDLIADHNCTSVVLTSVKRELRSKGLNKDLYRMAFENSDADAFVGVSHTPGAVKNRLAIGEEMGFNSYYCGYKNGDQNTATPAEDSKMLKEIEEGLRAKAVEYGYGEFQNGLPPHLISYGHSGIPPRRIEDVNLDPTSPLYKTFQKLTAVSDDPKRKDETIYGTLINVRRKPSKRVTAQ